VPKSSPGSGIVHPTGKVWYAFGYPTYGGGPFERVVISTSVPLLSVFLLVCVVEVVTAWMLWHLQPFGAVRVRVLDRLRVAVRPMLGLARSLALLPIRWGARGARL
jgi:hypothetical protein